MDLQYDFLKMSAHCLHEKWNCSTSKNDICAKGKMPKELGCGDKVKKSKTLWKIDDFLKAPFTPSCQFFTSKCKAF